MFSQQDASKTTAETLNCPENHSACRKEHFEGTNFSLKKFISDFLSAKGENDRAASKIIGRNHATTQPQSSKVLLNVFVSPQYVANL